MQSNIATCVALATAVFGLACSSTSSSNSGAQRSQATEAAKRTATVFFTSEMRGNIEPCGCSTDPLGDIARIAQLVADTRRQQSGAVLVIDGGSLLYSAAPVAPHLAAQEALKADLLERIYREELAVAAVGLGPLDLGAGPDAVKLPRQAANVDLANAPKGDSGSGIDLEGSKIVEAGGISIGIFGVVSPAALMPHGIEASDPVAAAQAQADDLRKRGAEVVIGIAHMPRRDAALVARDTGGIDFLLVGQNAPEPAEVSAVAQKIKQTYLIQPANRGQIISRVDITMRDGKTQIQTQAVEPTNGTAAQGTAETASPSANPTANPTDGASKQPAGTNAAVMMSDAIGKARAQAEIGKIAANIDELEAQIGKWEQDPSADAAFLAQKRTEVEELKSRRMSLEKEPVQVPQEGNWFTMEQVRIRKILDCHPGIQEEKAAYDQAAGKANLAAAQGIAPPAPKEGQAGYVGTEECGMCHSEAEEFWQTTRHFQAWETLEKDYKQFDYECISCHTTGWDQPGGANLAVNEHLRDVQCETCHGPGSLHVDADGEESPKTVIRVPVQDLCTQCHNSEHSDTFDYVAYLRDVTGPGHGEAFRKNLGNGKTGRELRQAGLAKAGTTLGAHCRK